MEWPNLFAVHPLPLSPTTPPLDPVLQLETQHLSLNPPLPFTTSTTTTAYPPHYAYGATTTVQQAPFPAALQKQPQTTTFTPSSPESPPIAPDIVAPDSQPSQCTPMDLRLLTPRLANRSILFWKDISILLFILLLSFSSDFPSPSPFMTQQGTLPLWMQFCCHCATTTRWTMTRSHFYISYMLFLAFVICPFANFRIIHVLWSSVYLCIVNNFLIQ